MSPFFPFDHRCAEGTLECGGLTPPLDRRGARTHPRRQCCNSVIDPPLQQRIRSPYFEGGVEPPHSKALRAPQRHHAEGRVVTEHDVEIMEVPARCTKNEYLFRGLCLKPQ